MNANLTGLLLFNFETNPCKNHSDTNLVKIHLAVIEILSFSYFHVLRYFSNSKWQPSWNFKLQKNITTSYKKHSGTKLDQFQPMGLEILSLSC